MALVDLIASVADADVALVHPESDFRLTYGALRQQARVLASALEDAGVQRYDRVAIAIANQPALVVAVLAASTIGVAVPLGTVDEGSLDARLAAINARAVIVPSDSADGVPRVHPTPGTRAPGTRAPSTQHPAPSTRLPGDIAVVLQTRGTTGPPKRVPLSHESLVVSATHVASRLSLGPGDVTLCVMPIAHVHGLVTTTLATLSTGGTVVVPGAFHPVAFWRIARDYGVTWFSAAPVIHQWLLARMADPGARRPAGAARLRFIRSAGSALPPAVARTLESAFGVPVVDGYEVTEASGDSGAARIAILDTEGRPVEPGRQGEIALAGPTVARGYDDDPDRTRKFFVDGWFRTGDFGYLDGRGRLALAGVRD